jgi:concentrative nucleoside transporter, CNT family
MDKLASFAGLVVFMLIAFALSENRKKISWRLVAWGIALQLIFALLILKTVFGNAVFHFAQVTMAGILSFTKEGVKFLLGSLATEENLAGVLAFNVLPVIIFTSSLMAVLYYFRVIQFVVKGMAHIMHKTMKASGAEAFLAALFVFMGIEAVTGVKAYIQKMTRSEIFVVMCAFFSTIAGSVMAVYVSFGASAGHLLAASVMSAPAAIVMAKMIIPETGHPETEEDASLTTEIPYSNPLEAAADGAADGAKLAFNIAAMLLAFVSLIALVNSPLKHFGLSLEKIFGYIFSPFAFLMGVPWKEAHVVGELLGIKVVLTEFLSYLRFKDLIAQHLISERTLNITTYALCGFTSLVSLAILIGGISFIAPNQKKNVVSLGIKALAASMLANFMTATIAGILL